MRVIAGAHKGRQLKAVPGMETRPTMDKIKEAAFHRMGPFFDGGTCLDLFAGSGALGIEALSRGMDHAIFVDESPKAIKTIRDHLKLFKEQGRSEVYRNEALRALEVLSKKGKQFSLILLDPPYDQHLYQPLIDKILEANLLESAGFLYVEHRPETSFHVEKEKASLLFHKAYNATTCVTIFEIR